MRTISRDDDILHGGCRHPEINYKLKDKMNFKQRLKSSYTMTRFEFSWKMISESRSRDRKRPITPGPF